MSGLSPAPPPLRDGEACGQHPAGGAEPAAGRRPPRPAGWGAGPAGAAHRPAADAGGLHAGGAARAHAVLPAAARPQPMSAWLRLPGRRRTGSVFWTRSV